MKNIANALLYNVAWFCAVWSAGQGWIWIGPLAMGALLALHFSWIPRNEWNGELRYVFAVACVGTLADSLLHNLGGILYPTSQAGWPLPLTPPWIIALWAGFATMPRFSMAWARKFHWGVAAAFGAIGGLLAFYGGTRLQAIEPGWGTWTYGVLALEYGVLMPLMIWHCPKPRPTAEVSVL